MKMEVGKKYQRDGIIIDIKFIDHEGTGWGLDQDGAARYADIRSIDKWNEYTEPKPPQYVPYTWEDRNELRGKWYRRKNNSCEVMVRSIECSPTTKMAINGHTAERFLEDCIWIDDTPCGKKVE